MISHRDKYRYGLSGLFIPLYDALCEELPDEWAPYNGLRSFAEQDALYAQGRAAKGKLVTNARGGESPHCYGCANDWVKWDAEGNPIWLHPNDLSWQVLIAAAEKVGLKSGVAWGDCDHVELSIKVRWPVIHQAFINGGMGMAEIAIKDAME